MQKLADRVAEIFVPVVVVVAGGDVCGVGDGWAEPRFAQRW